MSQFALPFALLCGLTLAALGASLCSALWTLRALRSAASRREAQRAEDETAMGGIRRELQTCIRQIQELRQEPPRSTPYPSAGPALNLSKRSQAIRMHRRGDPPEQIASTLGVPLQEIELLLKVHRIVIATL